MLLDNKYYIILQDTGNDCYMHDIEEVGNIATCWIEDAGRKGVSGRRGIGGASAYSGASRFGWGSSTGRENTSICSLWSATPRCIARSTSLPTTAPSYR